MSPASVPVMIFDDRCYLCSKFADIVRMLSRNKFLIVGHYSDIGMKIKSQIFEKDYDSTNMFWFVTKSMAYGGRAAILPLIHGILKRSPNNFSQENHSQDACDCKTPKAFFMRTKSLLSNSEKIHLKS